MSEIDQEARKVLEGVDLETPPGEVARRLRQMRRMSLKEMAQLLGEDVHLTTVGKIETGKMRFTLEWAYAFGRALNVPATTFHMPYDALNIATIVPVYIGLEPVRRRREFPGHHWTAYLTSRSDLFGVFITDIFDVASEAGIGTAIIDPARTALVEGGLFALANDEMREVAIGIYRVEHGGPRIIPWPSAGRGVFYIPESGAEIFGEVVQVQRSFVSRNG